MHDHNLPSGVMVEMDFPKKMTKGILSSDTDNQYGEQMAPQEGEHSDEDTIHADHAIQAMKAGDVEGFRDAMKAMIRKCIRDYGSGSNSEE